MAIPIQLRLNINPNNGTRIIFLGYAILAISVFSMFHLSTLQTSRESLIRWRMPNATEDEIFLSCSTPYDDNRCSIQSISSNHSENCLTDIQAMTGHILPLISFFMQFCLIRDLFLLRGNYSHIFVNILWFISFPIFIIVAIGAHGSTCYHTYTYLILYFPGCFLGGLIIDLVIRNGRSCLFHETNIIFEDETNIIFEDEPEVITNHDSKN